MEGFGPSRLRKKESRAATRAAFDIGDATEEAVNINVTIHYPVEETEPAENFNVTEKSGSAIRAADFSIYTFAEESDEGTNLEDSASKKLSL